MGKIIIGLFSFIFLLIVFAVGRREFLPSDGRYIVKHVEVLTRTYKKYHLVPVKWRLGGGMFVQDSVDYKIGDTLALYLIK